ncbi:MAG: hypothetical protein LC650_00420 [Actinobacteria bacterium]|nr:hypothetical protein [Actinomycetota bacterium]
MPDLLLLLIGTFLGFAYASLFYAIMTFRELEKSLDLTEQRLRDAGFFGMDESEI